MELIILFLLIIYFGSKYGLDRASVKGRMGENAVRKQLEKLPEDYKVLYDVMLRTERGTTQIDHIVLSRYGIFVIETKNYKGIISGGEYSDTWTKNMYGKKYYFQNPIRQNYGHMKALEANYHVPLEKCISIVAFSSSATIRVRSKSAVVYTASILSVIEQYKEYIFTNEEVDNLLQVIQNTRIVDREVEKEHVNQIREKKILDNSKVEQGICPRCGGMLQLRNGKYGSFYGCSNYPKCHFVKKL